MYLTYGEYVQMGGMLKNTAFNRFESKARYLINAQANGLTGERIAKLIAQLGSVPQCIKDLVYELVCVSEEFDSTQRQVASESQSQGGQSESVSYTTKTVEEVKSIQEDTIYNYLNGSEYRYLLYKGASV